MAHSSTRKKISLGKQSMTGRPASLWNVAIKSDFRREEWRLKARQTASACGQRCSPAITWAEMKHDLPPPTQPPTITTVTPSAPAALLLFLHLSSAWKNRGGEREGERERERERVPENECGGRDIIAFLSFFGSLPKGGGIAVSDWGYLRRTICWRSTLMNSALKVWVWAVQEKKKEKKKRNTHTHHLATTVI